MTMREAIRSFCGGTFCGSFETLGSEFLNNVIKFKEERESFQICSWTHIFFRNFVVDYLEFVKIYTHKQHCYPFFVRFSTRPFFRILDFMYGVRGRKVGSMTTQAIYALFIIFSTRPPLSLSLFFYLPTTPKSASAANCSVALPHQSSVVLFEGSLSATRNSSAAALCSVIRKKERNELRGEKA